MTTPTTTPPQGPPPSGMPGGGRTPGQSTPKASRALRSGQGDTVGFLQRWNVILPLLIAATGLAGVIGSFVVQNAARSTSEQTGPALIEVQDLFASMAEANTAATSAHLAVDVTGVEDRASRNLYDDALRRSHQQLAQVSADIGQDRRAQVQLQELGASLSTYSGEVEAARLAKLNGLPEADGRLRDALNVLNSEIGPSITELTSFGQDRYDAERSEGQLIIGLALLVGLVALAAMVWMQLRLAYRTKRILNPLLVLSTLALIGLLGLLLFGNGVRTVALNDADVGGYDAIASSAELQTSAFGLQSNLALLLLDDAEVADDRVSEGIAIGLAAGDEQINELLNQADSVRETAAAETLLVRWQRYVEVVERVIANSAGGDRASAVELFQSEGLSKFNGVNTAIESVLVDNRDQFSDGVDGATSAVELNPWLCLLLTVASGLLAIVAIQRRLGDFR